MSDAYVAQLLALAKEQAARDPGAAMQALRLLLGVRPRHAEAKGLLVRIGGADALATPTSPATPAPAGDPAAAVKKWENLLSTQIFGANLMGWKMSRDLLSIDMPKAMAGFQAASRPSSGPKFVLEGEFRWLDEYPEGWGMGLAFASVGSTYYCYFVVKGEFGMFVTREHGGDYVPEGRQPTDPIPANEWHRIAVRADGTLVEGFLDGKKILEKTITERKDWSGNFGVWTQNSKVEVKNLRIGRPE